MIESPQIQWPAVDSAYMDEFGLIDPEVHRAAAAIWGPCERLARSLLGDAPGGLRLMMRAAADVSRVRAETPEAIRHLPSYLFVAYRRLVVAEARKQNGHRQQEETLMVRLRAEAGGEAGGPREVDRRILLWEVMELMDGWTRQVFEWLSLGHGFAEIARWAGMSENAARNKFNRRVKLLAERLSGDSRGE
jgi:hypothetical protein